jgi:hypothetical protein
VERHSHLGEIVALNSGMRSRKNGTRALEMTTSSVDKLRHLTKGGCFHE